MSTRRFCDLCKKDITFMNHYILEVWKECHTLFGMGVLELCPMCKEDLKAWLEGRKK